MNHMIHIGNKADDIMNHLNSLFGRVLMTQEVSHEIRQKLTTTLMETLVLGAILATDQNNSEKADEHDTIS